MLNYKDILPLVLVGISILLFVISIMYQSYQFRKEISGFRTNLPEPYQIAWDECEKIFSARYCRKKITNQYLDEMHLEYRNIEDCVPTE